MGRILPRTAEIRLSYIYQQGKKSGYLAHQFYDLRDVVVVFATPRSIRWVGQVIASLDQLKNLEHKMVNIRHGTHYTCDTPYIRTRFHFAHCVTSGQRYCRVWISSEMVFHPGG